MLDNFILYHMIDRPKILVDWFSTKTGTALLHRVLLYSISYLPFTILKIALHPPWSLLFGQTSINRHMNNYLRKWKTSKVNWILNHSWLILKMLPMEASINTFQASFPDTEISGCNFHFNQALSIPVFGLITTTRIWIFRAISRCWLLWLSCRCFWPSSRFVPWKIQRSVRFLWTQDRRRKRKSAKF